MKKRGKKLLSYLLTLVLVLGLVPWISLPAEAATSNAAKEVAVNEPSLNVMSANEASLPENVKRAKDGTLTYSEDGLGTGNFAEEAIEGGTVYRLYNPNSGEHFYTLSVFERDSVVKAGWNDEGIAYDASVKASDSDATPVYRVYNPNAPADNSSHHYTCNAAEAQNLVSLGWRFEGVGFYVFPADRKNGMTVYREYNKNDGGHNYTTNKEEHDFLMKAGWEDENTAWKVKDVREVGTQKEMEAALATTSLTDLKIATNKKVELSIPEEDYALVDLVVDAPKASITNAGAFRSIDLRSIAANTWTEKGNNNDIVVNNTSPVRIIVDALNKILSSLRFNGNIDGVNTLEIPSGTLKQLIVAAKDPIYVSVFGDAEVGSVAVDYATNVNVVGKDSAAIGAVDMNAAGGELYISLLDDSTAGNITVSKEAYGTADEKTNVKVYTEDKAAVGDIEVNAAGAETVIEASGESTIGGVTVSESASSTEGEKTNVKVYTEDKAAVGDIEVNAADAEAVLKALRESAVNEIIVSGTASGTAVEIKADDSAKISSVTTSAEDANVSVTANGQSDVGTVKVEGPGQVSIDGNSSNKTTVDITDAVKGAKVVVKTGSVEIKTTPATDTSSIVDNQSGSSIPTKSTDSGNNETSGSIPPKDSGSGSEGGSEGGSGGSSGGSSGGYTPSTPSVKVSKVSIDNPNPKVGDEIRATVTGTNTSSATYKWYTADAADSSGWTQVSTAKSLTVTDAMFGKYIKLIVSGTSTSKEDVTTSPVAEKDGNYVITYSDTTGGTISGLNQAASASTVTLTVTPNAGYKLTALTATGEGPLDLDPTAIAPAGGTYTFAMPAHAVIISATFVSTTATLVLVDEPAEGYSITDTTITVPYGATVANLKSNIELGEDTSVSFKVLASEPADASAYTSAAEASGTLANTMKAVALAQDESTLAVYSISVTAASDVTTLALKEGASEAGWTLDNNTKAIGAPYRAKATELKYFIDRGDSTEQGYKVFGVGTTVTADKWDSAEEVDENITLITGDKVIVLAQDGTTLGIYMVTVAAEPAYYLGAADNTATSGKATAVTGTVEDLSATDASEITFTDPSTLFVFYAYGELYKTNDLTATEVTENYTVALTVNTETGALTATLKVNEAQNAKDQVTFTVLGVPFTITEPAPVYSILSSFFGAVELAAGKKTTLTGVKVTKKEVDFANKSLESHIIGKSDTRIKDVTLSTGDEGGLEITPTVEGELSEGTLYVDVLGGVLKIRVEVDTDDNSKLNVTDVTWKKATINLDSPIVSGVTPPITGSYSEYNSDSMSEYKFYLKQDSVEYDSLNDGRDNEVTISEKGSLSIAAEVYSETHYCYIIAVDRGNVVAYSNGAEVRAW